MGKTTFPLFHYDHNVLTVSSQILRIINRCKVTDEILRMSE